MPITTNSTSHLQHLLASWYPQKDDSLWVLGTVYNTEGPCYRKPGAMMLFNSVGQQFGLLSGGCLEANIQQRAAQVMSTQKSITLCYDGADEDDIMYDVFERYRVEEKNPVGAGTGIWKLPKYSAPQWSHDVIHRMHVMDDDKVDAYIAANIDNFWKKYDNNGTGEIYESEGETFMRALLGPNNRFRLAPGALSDMNSAG